MPTTADTQAIEETIDEITFGAGRTETAKADEGSAAAEGIQEILLAYDGSKPARDALLWTIDVARAHEARIHVTTIIGPPPYALEHGAGGAMVTLDSWKQLMDEERREGQQILDGALNSLKTAGLEATGGLEFGSIGARIIQMAEDRGTDLVVVGSHSRGPIERLVLGSVSDAIKHGAPCSVLIVKNKPDDVAHVLLPTDGSTTSRAAVLTGLRIGTAIDADARILHVVPTPRFEDAEAGLRAFEEAKGLLKERGRPAAVSLRPGLEYEVLHGDPVREILDVAKARDIGLVAMGSRGLGGVRGRVIGSVSNPVSHKFAGSVLLVK